MRISFTSSAWSIVGFVFLFAICAGLATATPAAAADVLPAKQPAVSPSFVAHPPLVAGMFDRVLGFFEGNLGNQRRMLQFGLAMMLLGLWIIWWRK